MKISIVATLYYSSPYIKEFYNRAVKAVTEITDDYEIIFVNDGSPDNAKEVVLELRTQDPRVTLLDLSRNFGHHRAMLTGLQYSDADYTFLIDTDLEEDPELITLFWENMHQDPDTDVIYGIQKKRKGEWFERITGDLYYKIFALISGYNYPSNTLTARLMSKRYLEGLKKFKETELDVWGLFIVNGFNQKGVYVNKKSKGTTTYTFRRKVKIAIDMLMSLSGRPLYLIFLLGTLVTSISVINFIYIAVKPYIYKTEIPDQTTLLSTIWLVGGLIMLSLGVVGIYLSKIFFEIKNRPLSIIKEIYSTKSSQNETN